MAPQAWARAPREQAELQPPPGQAKPWAPLAQPARARIPSTLPAHPPLGPLESPPSAQAQALPQQENPQASQPTLPHSPLALGPPPNLSTHPDPSHYQITPFHPHPFAPAYACSSPRHARSASATTADGPPSPAPFPQQPLHQIQSANHPAQPSHKKKSPHPLHPQLPQQQAQEPPELAQEPPVLARVPPVLARVPPVLARVPPVLARGEEIQTTHHPLKVSFPLRQLAEPARPQAQAQAAHHREAAWEQANHREQVRVALGQGHHWRLAARVVVAVGLRS